LYLLGIVNQAIRFFVRIEKGNSKLVANFIHFYFLYKIIRSI